MEESKMEDETANEISYNQKKLTVKERETEKERNRNKQKSKIASESTI